MEQLCDVKSRKYSYVCMYPIIIDDGKVAARVDAEVFVFDCSEAFIFRLSQRTIMKNCMVPIVISGLIIPSLYDCFVKGRDHEILFSHQVQRVCDHVILLLRQCHGATTTTVLSGIYIHATNS